VLAVEALSTPNLRYLPEVFEQFVADEEGDFSVALVDGEIVACAKLTVVADGSAWLETLRVIPEKQRLGLGKRFYERFFEVAAQKRINTMRMYTGVTNAASKGLAERFGFRLAASYNSAHISTKEIPKGLTAGGFERVADVERATQLLMACEKEWTGFGVMNRTFYAMNPSTCAAFCRAGQVYEDSRSGSVILMGARFMHHKALHIGVFRGERALCLDFAKLHAHKLGVPRVECMFAPDADDVRQALTQSGFEMSGSTFIVMEWNG
jgi:N-acetylglutamate synthase-like GNAT family acetyltransferase